MAENHSSNVFSDSLEPTLPLVEGCGVGLQGTEGNAGNSSFLNSRPCL